MATPKHTIASCKRFVDYVDNCGLGVRIREICLSHRVVLDDIYFDSRGPTIYAARLEVWWWLTAWCQKSCSEVGRMMDRDPTTISQALRRFTPHIGSAATVSGIDLETAHKISKVIADRMMIGWKTGGGVLAMNTNKKRKEG